MSSLVYAIEFTCDKCGTKESISLPACYLRSLDSELQRYTSPPKWMSVAVVEMGWNHATRHYCPTCNYPARGELGIELGMERHQSGGK